MPNLAGLTQAAALAAGIQPLLPKTEQNVPVLAAVTQDTLDKFSRWDKDKVIYL